MGIFNDDEFDKYMDKAGKPHDGVVVARAFLVESTISLATPWQHTASALSISNSLSNVKPTRKPGLNAVQRAVRLAFCLDHINWTLEDWKRVIWSDETSVILGQRRGAVRLWRESGEAYENTCIRRRWKGYSEFMFWGCFSWDKKGPCHIWTKETAQERKKADEELVELNQALEPMLKMEWELSTKMRRMNLRRRPAGKKPQWKFTKKNGKLVREGKAGCHGVDMEASWGLDGVVVQLSLGHLDKD
ncbi:hypothetical protein EPUS_08494 [Endocarpon pusillum Z07020]|uniref:Transposase Tc1-like domain-containing protein n=1 Tax=Endocarpon pusillum (strain Z07020 / HMAS-L-300199) TaxID=1263415 RepID=U1GLU8_ENDPU|nr:uncharacterized protein EPUS_08494 [Endocarpon pusillum Z07020]ERF72881.1 hypothetical protein EPUS_08494 [Endocarpon pusillum Z07020]